MSAPDPRFSSLLVIDDEPGIRRMMALDLKADGYQVFTAADGDEGLRVFEQQRPALVLTDLKMPGMDGIEVLRLIKERWPETEVIVITGHGDLELAIESLRLRASDFITKPIDNRALEVALARATERLCLRAELKSYTEELERRVEEATARVLRNERLAAVGQTVAALVHSLKNMLSGLKGGLYMIQPDRPGSSPEKSAQGMAMLERNVRRISELVRDLLTLSKPRDPELEPLDGLELLAEATEQQRALARETGVELRIAPSGPVPLMADRRAVLDSLANLIGNAIDAAAGVAGGRVDLTLAEARGEAVFSVEDNGPGLDREAKERIFEGFFSTKGAAGTGLGLMVAQKNATEHGGRVEYRDRPGGGACFVLRLPKDAAAATGPKVECANL